jgi:NADPH:quinone reductase-like Zn-dependent oxidoreductase
MLRVILSVLVLALASPAFVIPLALHPVNSRLPVHSPLYMQQQETGEGGGERVLVFGAGGTCGRAVCDKLISANRGAKIFCYVRDARKAQVLVRCGYS